MGLVGLVEEDVSSYVGTIVPIADCFCEGAINDYVEIVPDRLDSAQALGGKRYRAILRESFDITQRRWIVKRNLFHGYTLDDALKEAERIAKEKGIILYLYKNILEGEIRWCPEG